MITDAVLAPIIAAVRYFIGLLPTGQPLQLPSLGPVWDLIARVDSLVPILGPLQVMLAVLALGAVFIVVRLGLTLWNLIWP